MKEAEESSSAALNVKRMSLWTDEYPPSKTFKSRTINDKPFFWRCI